MAALLLAPPLPSGEIADRVTSLRCDHRVESAEAKDDWGHAIPPSWSSFIIRRCAAESGALRQVLGTN